MGGQSKGNGGSITVNAPNMTIDFVNTLLHPSPNVDVRGTSGNAGHLSITGANFTWDNSATSPLSLRANPVGLKSTAGSISISVDEAAGVNTGIKAGQLNLVTTRGALSVANTGGDVTVNSSLLSYNSIGLEAEGNLNLNAAVGGSITRTITLAASTGSVNINAPVGSANTDKVTISGFDGIIESSANAVVSGWDGELSSQGTIARISLGFSLLAAFLCARIFADALGPVLIRDNDNGKDPQIISLLSATAVSFVSTSAIENASSTSAIAAPSIFLSAPSIGKLAPVNINNELFGSYLLGVKSAGTVNLNNVGTPVPQLMNISTNSFTMTSDGDIAVGAANVGKTTAAINLTSLGNINNIGTGVNLVGKLVTLSTPYGSIGNQGGLTVSGGVATYSLASQNITNIAKAAMLQDLTALNGSINVQTATTTGTLLVASGGCVQANNGTITLENANTTTGTIVAGLNSMIETTGPSGGIITMTIGAASSVAGTAPAKNIDVTNPGSGSVFWGTNSITTVAPVNNIILDGANVIFNTGTRPASAIRLGGNVTIMTDPESPANLQPIGSKAFAGDDLIVDADSDAL
jgi:hypothetical protein